MGRWASDVFEVYTRMTKEVAARFTTLVGSTAFEDVERIKTEALDELASLQGVPMPGALGDVDDDGGSDDGAEEGEA